MDLFEDKRSAHSKHLANGSLEVEQRHTDKNERNNIGYEKDSSSISIDEIRESPEGTKAYTDSNSTHDILPNMVVNMRIISIVSCF